VLRQVLRWPTVSACLPPAINAETQAKRDGFGLGFSYLAGLYFYAQYARRVAPPYARQGAETRTPKG
jgi:hypothetical protein